MSILWRLIAFIVSRRPIARWLIWRAQCTPYFHLTGYMHRWWLFNPYAGSSSNEATAAGDRARHSARRWSWLPSIRVHHILRADTADHPHDHPWDARTIILEGGYFERRHAGAPRIMRRGDTAAIRHGDFHHIEHVSPGGVWTLFITWDYQGSWGFLVNGVKVPWRVYEAEHQRHEAAPRHGVTAQHARPVVALATCKHPDDERITVMSGSSWCGECGTRVAYDGGRPASPSQTAGRWSVGRAGCEIAHSDFGADVVLALSGDFATAQEREQFAQAVADRLNAAPAEAQPVEGAPIRYFAYDSDCGDYNEFDTLPEAIADAQEALDYAGDDGWPEGGPSIYYGAVLGEAREVEGSRRPAGPGDHPDADFIVEYELTGSDALAQQGVRDDG